MDENGVYTIYGSGRITASASDACDFMYKPVAGDFDVTVRIEEIPKFENQQVSGLMVRSGLENNSVMAMLGAGWVKNGENVRVFSRNKAKTASSEIYFKDKKGADCDNVSMAYSMPKYMRITREGNTLTFSVSNGGGDYTDNERQPVVITYDSLPETMYVGLATDTASGVSVKEYFSMAKFSRLTLNGESDVVVDDYKVPFYDTRFDGSAWYIPSSDEEKDCSSSIAGGNNGYILKFWGAVFRNFTPQKEGVITAAADYYMLGEKKEDYTGARFMLNGINGEGNTVKIASIYAQHDLGFFAEYDDTSNAKPSVPPTSENKPELKKWYKVQAVLDYNTGMGKYSYIPYIEYDSQNGTYTTGESIFDYEFEFDTSIAVSQLHFQRYGGWEMYLDNVGVDVEIPKLLYAEGGKVIVDSPKTNADLFIAVYDKNGFVEDARKYEVGKDAKAEFDIPAGAAVKAFLWDKNQQPLCEEIDCR